MVRFVLPVLLLGLVQTIGNAQQVLRVVTRKDSMVLYYHNQPIFRGKLSPNARPYRVQQHTATLNQATQQLVTITAGDFEKFDLTGEIIGSDESIACESEPRDGALNIVRHSVGPSHSLRNNAVYERKQDWLLSVDAFYPAIRIVPDEYFKYNVTVRGWEITLRFKPAYYQKHRGLANFNPASYSVWKKPVVGWCSWYAYLNELTENDVHKTADVLAEKLTQYGLNYLQIDDGYQQVPIGLPDTWLNPNKKFPSGLQNLAGYIRSKGLTPGIWTNVSFADSAAAYRHKQLFVQDAAGNPALGNWVGYVMDGSNPQTIQQLITPVYKGLNNDGWQYYKLDALRHLKYEGYNAYSSYFDRNIQDRNIAYRNMVKEVRKQIGKDHFLLACWGIRPELVGLADGCRIGNDGYSYAGLAQFNSYNNIIWRIDPDHIELTPKEAYRSCVATSLTGSVFMLTDKPETYQNSTLIEAAKRSIPVLYTQPGQVYDVDPSKSALIAQADVEMSGSGPRPFDASSTTTTGLFAQEINKPFENWLVLGRLDERDKILPFKDLGLDINKEYLVFEFWHKKLEGIYTKQFEPGSMDTAYRCQVFCFREKQNNPQLLATNRHISCGGLELQSLSWNKNVLQGSSEVVAGDDYTIYVYEPAGYTLDRVNISSGVVTKQQQEGAMRTITLHSEKSATIQWQLKYIKQPSIN